MRGRWPWLERHGEAPKHCSTGADGGGGGDGEREVRRGEGAAATACRRRFGGGGGVLEIWRSRRWSWRMPGEMQDTAAAGFTGENR